MTIKTREKKHLVKIINLKTFKDCYLFSSFANLKIIDFKFSLTKRKIVRSYAIIKGSFNLTS